MAARRLLFLACLALCGEASARTYLWSEPLQITIHRVLSPTLTRNTSVHRNATAPACDAINGETFTATGSTKYLTIGYVGLMQGSWAKYSQGYCQILTVY